MFVNDVAISRSLIFFECDNLWQPVRFDTFACLFLLGFYSRALKGMYISLALQISQGKNRCLRKCQLEFLYWLLVSMPPYAMFFLQFYCWNLASFCLIILWTKQIIHAFRRKSFGADKRNWKHMTSLPSQNSSLSWSLLSNRNLLPSLNWILSQGKN